MKKSSVNTVNRITVGKPKSSREPMRDDINLMSGNGASSSRPNSSMVEANGHLCIAPDVKVGHNVKFSQFINLYGCEVGDETRIGAFVEIQKGAKVGRRCKISSHSFICEGVTIEDEVFVGHNVTFINDRFPRATGDNGHLQTDNDWVCTPTQVKRGASIGSGATLLCGVTVGEFAI